MMRRSWENYGVKLEIAKRDLAEKGGGSTPLSAKVGNAYNSPGALRSIVKLLKYIIDLIHNSPGYQI